MTGNVVHIFFFPGGYGWVPAEHQNTLMWVPCDSGDPLPRGAVHVGMDKGGDRLYAGRAFHEGDLLPAKINPNHSTAYVCWGGMEHAMSHFEVRLITTQTTIISSVTIPIAKGVPINFFECKLSRQVHKNILCTYLTFMNI